MYSYIPFLILAIVNALLIYEFKNRQVQAVENEAIRRRRRAMNRTIIFITVFFILLTSPGAIATNLYSYLLTKSYGQLVIQLFGRFSSSYHAFGPVILYFTNQKFAQKLRSCFNPTRFIIGSSGPKDKTKSQGT